MLAKSVLDRIRQARRHAAEASAKKERRAAQAQLERLQRRLQTLRSRTDLGEVSPTEWSRTRRVLAAVEDRLERFVDRRPKRSRLERLAGQARRAARSLPG